MLQKNRIAVFFCLVGVGLAAHPRYSGAEPPGSGSAAPVAHAPAERSAGETTWDDPSWGRAIVFRTSGGRREYVGSVDRPTVPTIARKLTPEQPGGAISTGAGVGEYEIWFLGNGRTAVAGFSPARRQIRLPGDLGLRSAAVPEVQELAEVIRTARPSTPASAALLPAGATVGYPRRALGPTLDLRQLCDRSSVILVGNVAGILRQAHSPINSSARDQHTVYVVVVEEYLKYPKDGTPLSLVKIRTSGGPLPWTEQGTRGVGFWQDDSPMLAVGSRYCLFLRSPLEDDFLNRNRKRGYIQGYYSDSNGVVSTGPVGALDEYYASEPRQGKVLLAQGFARPAEHRGAQRDRWQFLREPQIVEVPEAQALAAIRAAVSAPPPDRRR